MIKIKSSSSFYFYCRMNKIKGFSFGPALILSHFFHTLLLPIPSFYFHFKGVKNKHTLWSLLYCCSLCTVSVKFNQDIFMIRYHTHIFEKKSTFCIVRQQMFVWAYTCTIIEVLHGQFSFEKWKGIAYILRLTLHLCVINIRAKEVDRHSIVDVSYVCPLLKIEHTALWCLISIYELKMYQLF